MTPITSSASLIPLSRQVQAAATASIAESQGTTQGNGAVPLAATGKRRCGVTEFLVRGEKRSKPASSDGKAEIKKDKERWLEVEIEKACHSLIEKICEKAGASGSSPATRKAVEDLVSEWRKSVRFIPHININNHRAKNTLVMTRLLVKIVQPQEFTFIDACTALRTVCARDKVINYLIEQAQASCRVLAGTGNTASTFHERMLSKNPFNRMVLGALHDDLVSRDYGYTSADVIKIAKHEPSALLLLASDLMNQPPFKSESDGDGPTDAAQVSRERKVNIARYAGSTITIFAVLKHFAELQQGGFSADQVLKMAGQDSGSSIIDAALKNHHALIRKGMTNKHIVTIASVAGGNLAIERTAKHVDELHKSGFENDQIVSIVTGSTGGLRNVELALEYGDVLRKNGYSHERIVKELCSLRNPDEKENLLREMASQTHETSIEPFPLASPPDKAALEKVLGDERVQAALGLAGQNTEPFSISGESASDEQLAQDVRELREAGFL